MVIGEGEGVVSSSERRPNMLLNILQCTEQPHSFSKTKPKNYSAPDINNALVGNSTLDRSELLMDVGRGTVSSEAYDCIWEGWRSQKN